MRSPPKSKPVNWFERLLYYSIRPLRAYTISPNFRVIEGENRHKPILFDTYVDGEPQVFSVSAKHATDITNFIKKRVLADEGDLDDDTRKDYHTIDRIAFWFSSGKWGFRHQELGVGYIYMDAATWATLLDVIHLVIENYNLRSDIDSTN